MTELRPCPFCGSTDILQFHHEGFYRVQCHPCGAMFQRAGFSPRNEWNTRNDKAVIDEFLAAVWDRKADLPSHYNLRVAIDDVYAERFGGDE